jgi:putative FmdB family regulatory protein
MTYEYACTACGHQWEAEQSISDAPLKICPRCNGETAKRQASGGQGFILKGGGWYADGYGSSKGGAAPKAEPKSETKPAVKTETTTETKGESKTESTPTAKPKGGG